MATTHATFPIAQSSATVVYDRQSGELVHVHEVWTERGARPPGVRTLQAEALAHARDAHPELEARQVAAIQVEPRTLEVKPGQGLRVDLRRQRLTRVSAPPRQVRSLGATTARPIRD